ncbi:DUF4357 domain-containing protein [Streptomyces albidoflavus]|uniref:DUF4357 domain-containing protein n=1 Tax=Streptomyces albidoflavus TaxID=1886 RepID=UPI0033AECC9D
MEDGERLRLTQAYALTHPSPAASVMLGCSVNGVDRWKDEEGNSLAAVREAETREAAEQL